jgi:hypothetical protein
MKTFLAALLAAATPALAAAQATPPVWQPAARPGTQPAPKTAAAKPSKKSGKLAPSARKAVEELTPIDDDDPGTKLSEADLAIARKVHVGDMPCELGATVKVIPMKREGMFSVITKGYHFRMHPVESRTGAIRLEDPKRGAMWLQLGNKSMLMSQKLGQRLADECQSPAQLTYAEALKKSPLPSILEPAPGPQSPAPAKAGRN